MKERYNVEGMTCTACSLSLERALKKVDGVEVANVNLIAKSLNIEYDGSLVNSEDILKTIKKCGFSGSLDQGTNKINKKKYEDVKVAKEWSKGPSAKVRLIVSFIILIPLMYVSMGHMINLPLPNFMSREENPFIYALVELILATPILFVNRKFFINGFRGLVHLSPNMDTLISLGSAISYIYGIIAIFFIAFGDTSLKMKYVSNLYFDASAMILSLITIGKTLEEKAKTKTTSAVEALKSLKPDKVNIVVDDITKEIDIDDLKEGDIIVVKAGEAIPADGITVEGNAYIDESAITGESIPVQKMAGDKLISATINTDGYLLVKAEAVGEDTILSKIINLVKDASGSKMNMQRLADRISFIFVPTIIFIALITFVVWLLIRKNVEPALFYAIQVLVISCPCALGLATPVAVTASIGACAKKGILIKNSRVFETLNIVDTIIFDKTGTLTTGEIQVKDFEATTKEELFKVARTLEIKSSHPLANAIIEYTKDYKELDAKEYKVLPGMGVECAVGDDKLFGGNKKLMELKSISVPKTKTTEETIIYFGKNNELIGFFVLSDKIRESAYSTIKSLKEKELFVGLLSGDSYNTCNKVKDELGIDVAYDSVFPEDKERIVSEVVESGKNVVFVGDGINDSPALSKASVGVAFGNAKDVAIDSAEIILLNDDLNDIDKILNISKKTVKIIKENLLWALVYNFISIPLAMGVLSPIGININPMIASLFMSVSSLTVVLNALRLIKIKEKKNGN